ncbi:MAG: DUF4998 domain-containing protein [Prolixibacteraceae bacterium]
MKPIIYCLVLALPFLWGCDGMDDTYREFIRDGEIIYVGTADSVKILPGKNRLKLNFLISDPTATKVVILWNNRTDSLGMPIQRVYQTDTITAELTGLNEGSYSFDIFTFDDESNSSVAVNAVGSVYGENYLNSLLDTPVKGAYVNETDNTRVDVTWGTADETALGSELIYTGASNEVYSLYIPSGESSTVLPDYLKGSSFQYRTLYLPEETAIDTFYTTFKTATVKGVATAYGKSGWVASGTDYDTGNVRPPKNAIDGKTNTVWHMNKTTSYPHSMRVDMGQVQTVSGFTFIQRTPLDGAAKVVEMRISTDGEEWSTVGEYTLENSTDEQFIDLSVDVQCRHFELIVKSDYKNGQFTALAEVGAYWREQFTSAE